MRAPNRVDAISKVLRQPQSSYAQLRGCLSDTINTPSIYDSTVTIRWQTPVLPVGAKAVDPHA